MAQFSEHIEQRIPAGNYTPQEQIAETLAVVRDAAGLLEVADLARIVEALASMRKPLEALARAGVLAGVTFQLRDAAGTIDVAVVLDAFDIGAVEAVDLSRVKLVASPQGQGSLQIVCADGPLGRELVEQTLLPCLSEETLDCCQVRWQGREPGAKGSEEDVREELDGEEAKDEYDNDGEDWR
jgi:hypothetical protein